MPPRLKENFLTQRQRQHLVFHTHTNRHSAQLHNLELCTTTENTLKRSSMHTHTGISTVRETRSDAHYAAFVYGTRDTQPRTTMWPIANPSSATDNRSFILAAIAVAFGK